jgi:hypothetical protein
VTMASTAKPPQLVAISLIQDSRSFITAAEALLNAAPPGGDPPHSPPTCYLICHAMELAIKGHLASCGVPLKLLRSHRIGHNIARAYRYGRRFFGFIPADARFGELVSWLGPYHYDHSFRYRKTGLMRLPAIRPAIDIVRTTVVGIEPQVRRRYLESVGK